MKDEVVIMVETNKNDQLTFCALIIIIINFSIDTRFGILWAERVYYINYFIDPKRINV